MAETKSRKISKSYNPNATLNATKIEEKSNPGVEKLTAVETTATTANTTATTANDGVSDLENEIGLINFNRLVDNSAAVDNFVNGFSDAFTDQTGVDTGNSTIYYNSENDTYYGPPQYELVVKTNSSTGWAGDTGNWTFGTNLNNEGVSSVSNLGGNVRSGIYWSSTQYKDGEVLKWKLNNQTTFNGMVAIYEAADQSHIGTTGNSGTFGMFSGNSNHWSNGNPSGANGCGFFFTGSNMYALNPGSDTWSSAVTWSTSDIFTITIESDDSITFKRNDVTVNAMTNHLTKTISDTSGWRFGIWSQLEGNGFDVDYLQLLAEGSNSDAATFTSAAQTASSAPDSIRLVVIGKEEFTQTMNTDTVMSVSRNNGANYTNVTMSDGGNYNSSGVKIWVGTADISGQPSGTSIKFKMTSTSSKRFTLHGYSLIYK